MKRYISFVIVDEESGCLLGAGRRFKDDSTLYFSAVGPFCYKGAPLFFKKILINCNSCIIFYLFSRYEPDYKDYNYVTQYGSRLCMRGRVYATDVFPNSYRYLEIMRFCGIK